MKKLLLLVVLTVGAIAAGASPARSETTLASARELYAAAAYEEALAVLDGLIATPADETDRPGVAMYRVLCLTALGRPAEAHAAIDALVAQHPAYRPAGDDLPPRLRSALTEARQRLLPGIIQQRYREAKAAFDRGEFASARTAFTWVVAAAADPDVAAAAAQPPLADIRTLATGFQSLSEQALAPPPPPAPVAAPVVAPVAAPARDYRRVYSPADADAVAPVTIRQALPRFPGRMTAAAAGVIELVVDETGAVESARLIVRVHPQYDNLALAAARKWQYKPARVDGVPVKYLKQVQVTLSPAD